MACYNKIFNLLIDGKAVFWHFTTNILFHFNPTCHLFHYYIWMQKESEPMFTPLLQSI